jgi:nitroreductase
MKKSRATLKVSHLDPYECIVTKLDVREFESKPVPSEVKMKILEAGRLAGSAMNLQHWRFILIEDRANLKKLAEDSTTGKWVGNATFAIIVLTDPKYGFHLIDAGRVVQDMELAAWAFGIVSCMYTGVNRDMLQRHFAIPNTMNPSVIIGFGYPVTKVPGKRKNRRPLRTRIHWPLRQNIRIQTTSINQKMRNNQYLPDNETWSRTTLNGSHTTLGFLCKPRG